MNDILKSFETHNNESDKPSFYLQERKKKFMKWIKLTEMNIHIVRWLVGVSPFECTPLLGVRYNVIYD